MAKTYVITKAKTEALHYVRLLIGDTGPVSFHLHDEEIDAFLSLHGLTVTSPPLTNEAGTVAAAIKAVKAIIACLSGSMDSTPADAPNFKKDAVEAYCKTLEELEEKLSAVGAGVSFANPSAFDTLHVHRLDCPPPLE